MTTAGVREIELVVDAGATLGEGPVWDADAQQLVWVDILGHSVHRHDPDGGHVATIDAGQPVGAVVPRAAGGLVLALRDGIALMDAEGSEPELVVDVERDNPGNRMNDAKCDPAGRLWAGTMAFDLTLGAGALYRIEADLRVTRAVEGVTVSNGLDWSPDASEMYYVDSAEQAVDAFDYDLDTGAVSNRRRLIEIAPADGMPDGLTVDAEGFLWVVLWDGAAVRRYAPIGGLDAVIELPVTRPTSCAFGGADYRDLYITSARKELDAATLAAHPLAGSLLRTRPGPRGRAPHKFAG